MNDYEMLRSMLQRAGIPYATSEPIVASKRFMIIGEVGDSLQFEFSAPEGALRAVVPNPDDKDDDKDDDE
jgi:hypothetical protein